MAIFLLIAILVSALYYAIIIYYYFAYRSIPRYQQINQSANQPIPNSQSLIPSSQSNQSTNQLINQLTTLSIIIPARNEAKNIERCLNSILDNNYPKHLFEIIVVDDHSEDDTENIVKKFTQQNVKLILLKDFVTDKINSYKKKAIEIAIAQASGTLIITTDADCIVPNTWLQTIAHFYEEKKPVFIAMPVLIETSLISQAQIDKGILKSDDLRRPSPWHGEGKGVRLFQALDFMTLQGITAAVVHKKQMTMCNGANMAYEKNAFYEVGGFAGIDKIASGDDMLLMHKIYKKYPNRVLFLNAQEAIVKTAPVDNLEEFLNQRIRWASKADKYDDKRILPVLILVYFFNVLLCVLPIVAIFNNVQCSMFKIQFSIWGVWLLMVFLKILVEIIFLYPVSKFYGKQNWLWVFPLLQPFHIVYTIVAGWLGKFGKYTWKQREVN
jgi:cellulose synthase/poly-beta-1,6-N-acetylglucosamine synthase-like glycosyltransferase